LAVIIGISAAIEDQYRNAAKEAGMNGQLPKPFSAEELKTAERSV